MNVGLCMRSPGFLQGCAIFAARTRVVDLDEVKTGAKLAWGGASEFSVCEAGHDLPWPSPSVAAYRWERSVRAARSWI